MDKTKKKVLIFLIIMAIVSPVGLYLPELFDAEDAWGEWSTEDVKGRVGYEPEGMKKDAEIYSAPVPDYSLTEEDAPFWKRSGSYIFSGIIGLALSLLIMYGFSRIVKRKEE